MQGEGRENHKDTKSTKIFIDVNKNAAVVDGKIKTPRERQ